MCWSQAAIFVLCGISNHNADSLIIKNISLWHMYASYYAIYVRRSATRWFLSCWWVHLFTVITLFYRMCFHTGFHNSFRPSDGIWCHWSRSTLLGCILLVQGMIYNSLLQKLHSMHYYYVNDFDITRHVACSMSRHYLNQRLFIRLIWEQIPMKFVTKCKHFYIRKCITACRL